MPGVSKHKPKKPLNTSASARFTRFWKPAAICCVQLRLRYRTLIAARDVEISHTSEREAGKKRRQIGALRLSSDLDHNLPKCSPCEMFISLTCFLERIHLIDHGADLVLVEECVHSIE